jgi:hypothetical protein
MERLNYDVGKKLEYLLTTGNLVSKSGLDLMQVRHIHPNIVRERHCLGTERRCREREAL